MLRRCLILVPLLCALFAKAETITSQSRQFVVHHSGAHVIVDKVPPGAGEVVPELLAVTAERVKQALAAEIPALSQARVRIHIGVIDSVNSEGMVRIAGSRFADAWRYEVAVPRVVEEARLVKGLINVLLLEYANRGAERSADLPAWLTEGLAEQLLYSFGPKLVVDRTPTAWEASTRDMHFWTRETLRTNTAPSFQDLTTANVPARRSPGEPIYLAGTHLLVRSLLAMPNGRQRFARFLQLLPHTWNWQTAFLQGFGFQRMLDVEKWWALTIVEFTTRDQRQAWSTEASLRRLDELLHTRIEYHSGTNALPEARLVDLKTLLEAEGALQRQTLLEKISQLGNTAPHLAPQVGSVALAYKKLLETFLQKRAGIVVSPGLRSTPEARNQALVAETVRRLAALNAKCRSLAEPTITSVR